jgi:probable O-glycosylation ligase (exosortase A-associated)
VRGILVLILVFGSLPIVLVQPSVGVLVWAWIGFMNPHRLAWGLIRSVPLSLIVAITTVVGMVVSGKWKRPPFSREIVLLSLFVLWLQVTTLFALNQEGAWLEWEKVMKIQFMILVTVMVVRDLPRIRALVWVIVASLGFYGVKGGVFTVLTGGQYRVWGPEGSFIDGNNELGLALIMVIPLMRYLQLTSDRRWVRYGLGIGIGFSAIAVLGTQSRGAMLGIAAMLALLVWKSKHRFGLALLMLAFLPAALAIMPRAWYDRMGTIRHYREDASATARLNSWQFAVNLALDRPVVGGGFETFQPELFVRYAPDPSRWHDAHSIYFEVLAEHGFVGLALFLCLGVFLWFTCSWIALRSRNDPDVGELEHLGRMIQASLIGYAVSGAFLGLAYFDLYYNMLALVVVSKALVLSTRRSESDPSEEEPSEDFHPETRGFAPRFGKAS